MTTKTIVADLFTTTDFYLSAVLLTYGFQLVSMDRSDPKRVEFCFDQVDGLLRAVEGYWAASLKVEPQKLFMHLKSLKSRIYSS